MRPRTTLLSPLVLLGAVAAMVGPLAGPPQALAASPEVKLEIAEHCYFADWPCWNVKGNNPEDIRQIQPLTITQGGTISFEDNEARYPTDVLWKGAAPSCTSGVPETPPTKTNWSGTCTFATAGDYEFESQELFNDGTFNYTKYKVVVEGIPKAKTTSTSTQHQTEATLTGSIEPEGNPTEYHFDYGSASVTEHSSAPTSLGAADFTSHSVSLPVSGLLPGTEYHFELIVSYGASQTVSGGPQTFTTPPATEPTVSTLAASALQETEATLNGKVDPEGGAEAEYFFEWGAGSSGAYEHTTKAVSLPSDGAEHQVSATATGLTPGSEYHFRLVAKNKLGSVQGHDFTFMAAPTPSAKEPPAGEPTKELPAKEPSPTPTSTGGGPTATTSSSPSSGQPKTEPASGPLLGSLELASTQHGVVVHGSLLVSSAGSEGQVQIELLTKGAAAAVGKLVRSSLHAGKLTFTLSLSAKGKAVLRRRRRLTLTVKITLTPLHGAAVTVTHGVVLRA
jgi:hypothetical protein